LVVFIDGDVISNTSAVGTGTTIPGNGVLVVGQKVTGINPLWFGSDTRYEGYLTDFNLWNITLNGHVIAAMSKAAGRDSGDVISWNEMVYGGEVMGGLSFTPTEDVTTNGKASIWS
jgi:hypothetical protein